MSLIRATFFIAAAIFLIGCDAASPKVPNTPQKNYPAVIADSSERRTKAEREWRQMLDAYNVQQTPPDLYPIIYTPRSLLGVTGGIKIMAAKPEPGNETIALREAVKGFIDRWRDLLGADLASVSLVGGDQSSQIYRLTYRQSNYSFPIAGNYGEMVAVISADGRLMQLDSRFIPVIELPARPQVEREAAAKRVVGRTFTYSDITGREQRTQVTNPGEVIVKQAVILPVEKGDAIEVHLAWEIVAGSSLTWTVYVDAINGDELKVVQNFQT
ncbi:MAG TPA: hypothetical protein VNI02_16930 [Blastocatellia bacterium]|jgi:hypothetical protein|nr:hypothetical protein [Blastocatellia bacterium]